MALFGTILLMLAGAQLCAAALVAIGALVARSLR